ncbi:FHA domain-containing protein, partial [Thermodesulfobacteriota bacterium]
MAKLYVWNGPENNKSFDFSDNTIFIGRSPENDVQIRDILVSRRHLKVCRQDNKYS